MSNSPAMEINNPQFGLCLSGGGFRATFFHLGLIKLLRESRLLGELRDVCSVSGGSILAANLASEWDNYISPAEDETAFYQATLPLIKLARSDLRGRIVRRWLLLGWAIPSYKRTRLLEKYYYKFVSKAELGMLPPKRPNFNFLATSFTRGNVVSFTREGFHDGEVLHKSSDLPLAFAVTASSAFPPLFTPAVILRERLGAKVEKFQLDSEYLTDGGIFDNLGVAKMSALIEDWPTDIPRLVIISNASAPFDWDPGATRFPNIFERTVRSTDILMKRVGDLEESRGSTGDTKYLDISIEDIVQDSDIQALNLSDVEKRLYRLQDQKVQKLVSKIRTDFDSFSMEEICSLVRHGYEVGLKYLLREGLVSSEFKPRDPCLFTFPKIGWPQNEEWMPYLNAVRAASNLTEGRGHIIETMETGQRKMKALLGQSVVEHSTTSDTTADQKQVRQLRERLVKSSKTSLKLWNSGDLICWLFVFFSIAIISAIAL